jgi:hypothetical protein
MSFRIQYLGLIQVLMVYFYISGPQRFRKVRHLYPSFRKRLWLQTFTMDNSAQRLNEYQSQMCHLSCTMLRGMPKVKL